MITMSCENIRKAESYSEGVLRMLRDAMETLSLPPDLTVVVVGSLARREASEQSDVDYFVIQKKGSGRDVLKEVGLVIESLGLKAPSPTGAFAQAVKHSQFLKKIGGNNESNDDLTRRMLFLLESEWIYGREMYESTFRDAINLYIREHITQHQLARFFLNDLIRYYRTICVDFEYKTASIGKSWGDRNIKLMFSRKLLYFSGILAAAETAQSTYEYKRSRLIALLRKTPIQRMTDVCGDEAGRVMIRYDQFLGWMSDESRRKLLKETTDDRSSHEDLFREMKNAGYHFSWCLESMFYKCYAPTHPINQAILL